MGVLERRTLLFGVYMRKALDFLILTNTIKLPSSCTNKGFNHMIPCAYTEIVPGIHEPL